jgi:hypothetical protein
MPAITRRVLLVRPLRLLTVTRRTGKRNASPGMPRLPRQLEVWCRGQPGLYHLTSLIAGQHDAPGQLSHIGYVATPQAWISAGLS